ncbi:uncharacterized protein BT62DRAFT_913382, partial [Guyanagaster necrorhizus]
LYDSGASRHMSPYRYRFLNFVSIQPKHVTAADNGKSSALGRRDMKIATPGKEKVETTILLKDVLYGPTLGGTLVSVSNIAALGHAVLL